MSEYFHGEAFQSHRIFSNDVNSIRNVLFILSLDWLPLHKIGNYSLGILSISAANHTKTRRSRGGVWPLVLLEGPREPKVLFSLLSDAIREIEVLFQVGCTVSDTLTGENIHVRAGIVTTVNDLPASSKLGLLCRFCHLSHLMNCLCPCHTTVGHAGHSAYIFCPMCHFSGCVCGCKTKPNEEPPSRFDNRSRRSPFTPPTVSYGVPRPKRPGEHIVFVDTMCVTAEQFRSEAVFRACQTNLWKRMQSPNPTQKSIESFRRKCGVTSLSPLAIASIHHFKITTGVSLDG